MTRLKLPSRLNFKSSSLRLIECSRIRTILDTLPATQRKEKSISKKISFFQNSSNTIPKSFDARSFIDSKKKFHLPILPILVLETKLEASRYNITREKLETKKFSLEGDSRNV